MSNEPIEPDDDDDNICDTPYVQRQVAMVVSGFFVCFFLFIAIAYYYLE